MQSENDTNRLHRIIEAIREKKGQDPVVLDLSGISPLCDYFVIASAPSVRQVKAIAEEVKESMEKGFVPLMHQEGFREGRWILLDYGDLVIHLFVTEDREYYQLETIWKDAPTLDIDTCSSINV